MIDIEKQIAYWRDGSVEDWQVAQELIDNGRMRHGLFFAHLSLEKLLKAHVCRHIQDLAPKLHNLSRLAEMTTLSLSQDQISVLAKMNEFNIEGRYPDSLAALPSTERVADYLSRAEEMHRWLMKQLQNP